MSESPIRWTKVDKGHYRNLETGVEIKFGVDSQAGGSRTSDVEGWWVYEPQPGPTLELWPMGWQLTFAEAKRHEGADLVSSMRCALADESFAPRWAAWKTHLENLRQGTR